MIAGRAYIAGTGIATALGSGWVATRHAFHRGQVGIRPLSLFTSPHDPPLPVGQIQARWPSTEIPRTHQIARIAAGQILGEACPPPDAIVVGSTTGGLLTTENLLKNDVTDPETYRFHSPTTVAETIAKWCGCQGPVLTVSTACSSGAVALKIALEMIRTGTARRVLAGGVDSLCRLTYYGFHSLQLIDSQGARPLDRDRRGMSVAEGAAMVMLAADDDGHSEMELLGAGLSCDAHHPTAPHPEGRGALAAMQAALADAGLTPGDIDYINLHGTGTRDNDLSETKAVVELFQHALPPMSSVKGAVGHSLAAAGAVEAVIAANCVNEKWIPGTTGLTTPDPTLNVTPATEAATMPVGAVLSNSLGFGGNNASVVIGHARYGRLRSVASTSPLTIVGAACITGAGHTDHTLERLATGGSCAGKLVSEAIVATLPQKRVRRLQRLPRLTLALSQRAHDRAQPHSHPTSIFMGTGWGAMSETYRFLTRLFETDEKFPSPTDFIGSVHNAPAGQTAMMFGATDANVTTTGGDTSFEQALMVAGLLSRNDHKPALVVGADEAHDQFSPLFDESVRKTTPLADGGGALLVKPGKIADGISIRVVHYEMADDSNDSIQRLIQSLAGSTRINTRFGFILAGIPAAQTSIGANQLIRFKKTSRFAGPIIDYRKWIGQFATASAVAAVLAATFTADGKVPGGLTAGGDTPLNGMGGLVLGLGRSVTAMEVERP